MANGTMERTLVTREIAFGAKPVTKCEQCNVDLTAKNTCCADGCYVVDEDGVVCYSEEEDTPNAWDAPTCDQCCPCRSNRVGYEAAWAQYDA